MVIRKSIKRWGQVKKDNIATLGEIANHINIIYSISVLPVIEERVWLVILPNHTGQFTVITGKVAKYVEH
jgi:hypothetical protein